MIVFLARKIQIALNQITNVTHKSSGCQRPDDVDSILKQKQKTVRFCFPGCNFNLATLKM